MTKKYEDNYLSGKTPLKGRLRYACLDEKRGYMFQGSPTTPAYSATLIFDKVQQSTPEFKEMVAQIKHLLVKKFGAKVVELGKVPEKANPLKYCCDNIDKDGNIKEGFDVEGGKYIKFSSVKNIVCLTHAAEIINDPDEIKAVLYQGCHARVDYTFALTDKGPGVSAWLNQIQKTGNNTKFSGGGTASTQQFEAVDIGDDDDLMAF